LKGGLERVVGRASRELADALHVDIRGLDLTFRDKEPSMMSFRGGRLEKVAIPPGTAWLLTEIAEAKGRQDLYAKRSPQVLRAVRETAIVQSVESSNRIEGVTVAPDRLRPLVLGRARTRTRPEEEIQGYARALDWIHSAAADIEVSPEVWRKLHRLAQEGGGDAGEWKRVNIDIVGFRPDAAPRRP
jgi:hypothetical protein